MEDYGGRQEGNMTVYMRISVSTTLDMGTACKQQDGDMAAIKFSSEPAPTQPSYCHRDLPAGFNHIIYAMKLQLTR